MNYTSWIYKALRYLAQALAIFLIFRFMPELTMGDINTRLSNSDILMITVIIMLVYILFENLCNLYSDEKTDLAMMTASEKNDFCSSVCSRGTNLEHMANVGVNGGTNVAPAPAPAPSNGAGAGVAGTNVGNPNVGNPNVGNPNVGNPNVANGTDGGVRSIQYTQPDGDDQTDIAILKLLNQRPHGPEFYRYLKNLRHYEKEVDKHNNNPQIIKDGSREKDGLVLDDLQYSDYNHLPMAVGHDSRDYEYGYSYLPPSQWYPKPAFPPVCVTNQPCAVCPVYTSGTPSDALEWTDMKDWDSSRKILPPDRINVKYAEMLNGGR